MSKTIKMTPEIITEIREEFEKAVKNLKMADGKFTFSKSFGCQQRKATIHYTKEAWEKQARIIKDFDKEVAWHGVAFRDEDEDKDEYYITDILVYPQTVTSTTVEMDTEKYAKWLMENDENDRFSNIHMQAHSHVNMGTTPSTVDLAHQEEILAMLNDDGFYIFMIWNKSHSKNNKIYDMKKNVLFENADITVVVDGEDELSEFIKEAKSMVESKTYAVPTVGGSTAEKVATYQDYFQKSKYRYNPYDPTKGYSASGALKKPDSQEKTGRTEKARTKPTISCYQDDADEYDYENYLREVYGESYSDPYFYR